MNTQSALTRLFRVLHHRSLTVSVIAVFVAFLASGFLPESDFRLQQQGPDYLLPAYIVAILGLAVCCVGFVNLLKDDRSGYEAFRLSVGDISLVIGLHSNFIARRNGDESSHRSVRGINEKGNGFKAVLLQPGLDVGLARALDF